MLSHRVPIPFTDSVGLAMSGDVRTARRVLHAVGALLVVAGCGSGGVDSGSTGSPTSASYDVSTSDLAGVQIDVRRDPG